MANVVFHIRGVLASPFLYLQGKQSVSHQPRAQPQGDQKTLKLWAFITQVIERTFLDENHSKILLVKGDNGTVVSVVTSQNLTRGKRAESAFISTDPEIFAGLFAQVNDLITNHSVPLNDLFSARLNS